MINQFSHLFLPQTVVWQCVGVKINGGSLFLWQGFLWKPPPSVAVATILVATISVEPPPVRRQSFFPPSAIRTANFSPKFFRGAVGGAEPF